MVAKRQVSIVDDTPGTTRDRVSVLANLESPDAAGPSITVELTDTGGYGVYTVEGRRINDAGQDLSALTADIEHQIAQAVESADLVLFVIDTQAGITAQDQRVADLLRRRLLGGRGRADLPIMVVANKTDGPRWESHAIEAAALGFGEPLLVSAHNNYLRREFLDRLYETVTALPRTEELAPPPEDLKIAIIGKRNAGKSTLVNTLAGEQRVIVSEIAGTTRDAVDVRFELDGRAFVAIDTAGLRRKKSFDSRIEWWAYDRVQKSIERAGVVLLLIDATESVSQVDEQLAMLVQKSCKPAVIVVNKWDAVEGKPGKDGRPVTTEDYETYLRKELKGLDFAPIAFISGATGLNVRQTIDLAFELYQQASQRVGTGELNRLVRAIVDTRGPTSKLGTFAKVYFVAQVAVNPPTIVAVVNRPELFTPNYQRFLLNRFREELPFPEVPIKLIVRGRKRAGEEDEAITGAREGAGAPGEALADLPEDAAAYFTDEASEPPKSGG
jgi:GTP-binding protein